MAAPIPIPKAARTDSAQTAGRPAPVAYVDPQSYHGLAKYDVGYLRGLQDAGFDGELRFYCSKLFEEPAPERVTLRPIFAYNRKRTQLQKVLSYLLSMIRLAVEASSVPAAIYHFQWFKLPAIDYFFVRFLQRIARARVVMTAHNVVPHDQDERPHRALGRLYRAVDAIVVHNENAAQEIAVRFAVEASRISVLRHGPIELSANGPPRHRKRIERFARAFDLCFLFFGRGSRYKGLDILLDAWPRFAASAQRRCGLMVIGAVDEELRGLAEHAARAQPSLLLIDEYVPETDLHHAIRRADVAVLPHRRISQSGALLAALARRLPVLVSRRPGLLEPLEIAGVGWEFDGSADGLVEALRALAAQPERVAEVRADDAAWEVIEEAYAWRRIGLRAKNLYSMLAAHRNA